MAGKGEPHAEAAPLEAEDDLELLEKVKKDRKKRLERQGVINSSTKEKGHPFFFSNVDFILQYNISEIDYMGLFSSA